MKQMAQQSPKNDPAEYDAIFFKRKEKGPDPFDLKRWHKLLKYYRGGKLLDAGCLDSLVPNIAKKLYPKAEVWGIDLAEEAINEMQYAYPDILYRVEDVYHTKFPSNYFDYIVAGELIEHLEHPRGFFKEVFRILKHGGTFALSTPQDEAREPGAVDAERHLWSYSTDDIRSLLSPYGSTKIITLGSQFFPSYIYHWPIILAYCRKL